MKLLNFESLIAPGTKSVFLQEMLGRRYLRTTGDPHRFQELSSWQVVNRLLAFGGIGPPRLNLVSGGSEIPAGSYSRPTAEGWVRLLVPEVTGLLRDGATLVINSAHELCEALCEFSGRIEQELQAGVSVDLYATWPSAPKRSSAWNDHEAIVLQIDGSRVWTLFEPTGRFPTAVINCPEPEVKPIWAGILEPGHLLYVPRGWWVSDEPSAVPALYLVMRFRNPTGFDLVARRMGNLQSLEVMRMDVPRFADATQQAAFLGAIQAEIVRAGTAAGLILGTQRDILDFADPHLMFGLPWSAQPAALPPSEDYEVVPLLRFPDRDTPVQMEREASVELLCSDGRPTRFPLAAATLLAAICGNRGLTLGEVIATCEGEMSRDRARSVVGELVRCGVVSLREPTAGGA